jgi:hypothetical protein
MSLCTNTPEGAGEGTAGGGAGAAGGIPDSAGFSLRQPALATEKPSKATDTVQRSRCALNDSLQIIQVRLSNGFQVAVATILWRGGTDSNPKRSDSPLPEHAALALVVLGLVYLPIAKWFLPEP